MNEKIIAWVEALESGKYTQVEGTLKGGRKDGTIGYCCLGVFCEINGKELKTEEFNEEEGWFTFEGSKELYDFCDDEIKQRVKNRGIEMNDDGKSFLEIAKMIRKEYNL